MSLATGERRARARTHFGEWVVKESRMRAEARKLECASGFVVPLASGNNQ